MSNHPLPAGLLYHTLVEKPMPTEPTGVDPYEAVLRDLRAKRDEIDITIRSLENLRGITSQGAAARVIEAAVHDVATVSSVDPGEFLGMTIVDAAKKLLTIRRRYLTNPEIVEGLQSGGLVLRSADPANTVGTVLKRREDEVGDLVRVSPGRGGKWGLTEWAPHLKKKSMKEAEVVDDGAGLPGTSILD